MIKRTHVHYIQCIIFVGIWITLGFVLKLDPNSYLLTGIPLMLIFQVLIRKQPIHKMWVRDGSSFHLDKWGILLAVCFMIYPAKIMISLIMLNKWNPATLWCGAAIIGALGAAYSFRQFTRGTIRQTLLCLATAGSIGIVLVIVTAIAKTVIANKPFEPNFLTGIKSLLLYIPGVFMIEEVVFRGMIDAHVHRQNQARGIWSAIFVGVLWGLFHLPVVVIKTQSIFEIAMTTSYLVFVHTIIGIPLSIYWRKSGNLAVPAFTHAFIDAIRNALLFH
jgi:membrane protease YdiL (CAAX protease family)